MKPVAIASLLSFVAAFAVASFVYRQATPRIPDADDSTADLSGLPLASRLAALEQALAEERNARQLLQEEVFVLGAALDDGLPAETGRREARDRASDAAPGGEEMAVEDRRAAFARRNSQEGRVERLVTRGIEHSLATWIVRREEELQMEALTARYEAGQRGSPADFYRDQLSPSNILRDELGDENYERYLAANGRPTSVAVSSVLGSSPAQAAGMKAGDVIVRYDGNRVFSMTDINLTSMKGQAGESVAVDILRDGIAMQVVIPRGPLGITGGRR